MKHFITWDNLPPRFNLLAWFCFFTCLHYWNAPQWIYGVFGVVFFIAFGNGVAKFFTHKGKDIFK